MIFREHKLDSFAYSADTFEENIKNRRKHKKLNYIFSHYSMIIKNNIISITLSWHSGSRYGEIYIKQYYLTLLNKKVCSS